METTIVGVASALIGGLLAALITFSLMRGSKNASLAKAWEEIESSQRELDKERRRLDKEIKETLISSEKKLEQEFAKRRIEVDRLEKKLQTRETSLDRKFDTIDKREGELREQEKSLDRRNEALDQKVRQVDEQYEALQKKCEEVSGMTTEQARQMLLDSLEKEVRFIQ